MQNLSDFDAVDTLHLPISERVLDKLGDILLASDEILGMIAASPQRLTDTTRSIEESVKSVFEQVNALMKSLAD